MGIYLTSLGQTLNLAPFIDDYLWFASIILFIVLLWPFISIWFKFALCTFLDLCDFLWYRLLTLINFATVLMLKYRWFLFQAIYVKIVFSLVKFYNTLLLFIELILEDWFINCIYNLFSTFYRCNKPFICAWYVLCPTPT